MSAVPPSRRARRSRANSHALSAVELIEGYRSGSFTPSDVIDEVIDALVETDEAVQCHGHPDVRLGPQSSREWRRELAQRHAQGPLAGVPVTVKDLIFVAGVPARGGAPALENFVPEVDAAVVTAASRSRCNHHLQDHDMRVGLQTHCRQSGVGRDAQSVATRPHQRGVERRRSCRGRGGMRSARTWDRRRRFDPSARIVLRRVRHQAYVRAGAPSAGIFPAFMGLAGSHRPNRADGARRGVAARNHRRLRHARCR